MLRNTNLIYPLSSVIWYNNLLPPDDDGWYNLPFLISYLACPLYRQEGVMREFEPEYIMGELKSIFTLIYFSLYSLFFCFKSP